MRTAGLVLLVMVYAAGIAPAQMGGGVPPMAAMAMGPGEVAAVLGPDLMAACHADLGRLGLSPEVLKADEDRRFELQKKVIRVVADLRVLRLELARLLDAKGFDLAAAQQKGEEITAKEGELRTSHLRFLSELRASLTDEQWHKLRTMEAPAGAMPGMGAMMPMKGGPMPWLRGGDGQPSRADERGAPPAVGQPPPKAPGP